MCIKAIIDQLGPRLRLVTLSTSSYGPGKRPSNSPQLGHLLARTP